MPDRIVNRELYFDRTVQDWHRLLDPSWAAIDIDLLGYCRVCRVPIYLIEATTNSEKPVSVVSALARRADLAAFVVYHNRERVTGALRVEPAPAIRITDVAAALAAERARHQQECCGHPYWKAAANRSPKEAA